MFKGITKAFFHLLESFADKDIELLILIIRIMNKQESTDTFGTCKNIFLELQSLFPPLNWK